MAPEIRKLATILALDVANYSRAAEADDSAAATAVRNLRATISEIAAPFGGRIFNSAGDGFMVEFPSASAGVKAASALLKEGQQQSVAGAHHMPRIRIGVHLGDVIVEENGDLLGHGVNIAARLQALAEPGAALVSETVRAQMRSGDPHSFTPQGRVQLSKMNEKIAVYALTADAKPVMGKIGRKRLARALAIGAAALAVVAIVAGAVNFWPAPQQAAREGRKETYGSIAVLPFVDMSEAKDQEYFSDGVAEELLNALARNKDLRVAARTSSFLFKNKETPLKEIASALNVETVLEGSVRKAKDRLRITAQLIDAETGFHLWSETYETELDDIFAIQDEIANTIVGELNRTMSAAPAPDRPQSVEAYEAYLAGNFELQKRTAGSIALAREKYREAIALEPDFGPAYAQLSLAYAYSNSWTSWGDLDPTESMLKADAALAHAEHLAPDAPETLLAGVRAAHDAGDGAKKDELLGRLLRLYPSAPDAYESLAEDECFQQQRCTNALAFIEDALALDPLSPQANYVAANVMITLGRTEEAIARVDNVLKHNPQTNLLLVPRFFAYVEQGDESAALNVLLPVIEAEDDRITAENIVGVLATLGFREEAIALASPEAELSVRYLFGDKVAVEEFPSLASDDRDLAFQADLYFMAGRREEALERYDRFAASGEEPDPDSAVYFAYYSRLLKEAGRSVEAAEIDRKQKAMIAGLRADGWADVLTFCRRAGAAAASGENSEALDALEAVSGRMTSCPLVLGDPLFDNLRRDPRFKAVVAGHEQHVARERQQAIDEGAIARVRAVIEKRKAAEGN